MPKLTHLLCLLALLTGAPCAWALDSNVALSDYHHDIWTGKDGAPGEVAAMAQTTDGWMWVGSSNGLYRFDGVRFRRFEALSGEVAPKRPITALKALRNGDLLIGYIFGGVSRISKGHIIDYPSRVGNELVGPVLNTVMDDDGVVWAATTGGLLKLVQGAWRNVGAELGLPPGRVSNILIDQYQQMWLAAGEHLVVLQRGAQRFRLVLHCYSTTNLSASPDGRLWLDTHGKLITVPAQHPGPPLPRPAWMAQAEGQESGLFDRDGNFWTLGCPGVCRTDGLGQQPNSVYTPAADASSRLDQPWQVSNLTGNVVFEDRDGSIWIGTQAGVERFRNNRLTAVKMSGGERFFTFALDQTGTVLAWATPTNELWRLNYDGTAVLLERGAATPFGVLANSPDGALLKAGREHIERRLGDQVQTIAYPDGQRDRDGVQVTRLMDDGRALWLSISRRGSFRWLDGRWTHQSELGLPNGIAFAAPGRPGEMWFGYNDGLVLRYDNGKLTRYPPQPGGDVGAITFVHSGPELLIGGNGGLAVLQGGRFRRLSVQDPEVLSRISGMAISANGDRWLNGSQGVVHVRAEKWQAALAHPQGALEYTLYGVLDGYPGFAATANRMPSAIADAQGQLWFAGVSGIARLDGTRAYPPTLPPEVKIETLVAQGKRYLDFVQPVLLPPGTTSLRVEYTALSYTMPEGLHFRYQLEGVDQGWQDPGSRRAASYTNLGPGDYRFRVAAVNQFGQWNKEETAISVRILPTFTQTPLFYGLCALATAGLLYLLYRLWARQATLRIATRMAERERIARTLHDSFLQSVHGLTLSFQSALGALPADSASRHKIERVLLMADKVMEEGRNEVQELRSGAMGDGNLAHSLMLVGEVLQESQRAVFSLRTLGQPRQLDEQAACEAYNIGREAVLNAFRHADAAAIQVELHYAPGQFSLQVADDGKGIADELMRKGSNGNNGSNGSNGHWGLTGMYERAARIGGHVVLEKVQGGGTRVRLTVPAARAYTGRAGWAGWKRWLPRWFS